MDQGIRFNRIILIIVAIFLQDIVDRIITKSLAAVHCGLGAGQAVQLVITVIFGEVELPNFRLLGMQDNFANSRNIHSVIEKCLIHIKSYTIIWFGQPNIVSHPLQKRLNLFC